MRGHDCGPECLALLGTGTDTLPRSEASHAAPCPCLTHAGAALAMGVAVVFKVCQR